jgi:hypothetical protein
MKGELDTVSRRRIHNRMRQGSAFELLGLESALTIDTDALQLADSLKGLVQGFKGRNLESKVMESNILAAIKGSCVGIRLPKREHGGTVVKKQRRVSVHTSNFLVAESFKELERSVKTADRKANVRDTNGKVVGAGHVDLLVGVLL